MEGSAHRWAAPGELVAYALPPGFHWLEIVAAHAHLEGPLLPVLHAVQAAFGFIPREAISVIAHALNLTRAEVYGVVTFYHDFREQPAGRRVVKLCRAEACQARGVEALAPLFERDERIEVETVYCLGLCASGPSAMVGDRVFARLDESAAQKLIGEVAA